ncbi:MAG: phage tail assembly protein [Isosphaeraceae bacterium]
MGTLFTLDSIREEVEKEFAPVKVALSDGTEVTLRNLLRLNKDARKEVLKALKDLEDIQGEDGTSVEEIELLVDSAETVLVKLAGADGEKLVKEIDGDVSMLLKIMEYWMGSSQPGEAQNSPSS